MVDLSLPQSASNRYIIGDNYLSGPFDLTGSAKYDTMSLKFGHDSFSQSAGRYGENNVSHLKYEGNVVYIPATPDITRTPGYYPNTITWKTKIAGNQVIAHGCSWESPVYFTGDSYGYTHQTVEQTSNGWIVYYAYARNPASSTELQYVQLTTYKVKSVGAYSAVVTVTKYDNSPTSTSATRAGNWRLRHSFAEIKAAVLANASSTASSIRDYTWDAYETFSSPSVNPTSILNYLNTAVLPKYGVRSTIVDVHYGDVVMDAVSHLNANSVNMLEFLSDLRHPTEMIPKLKRLSSLKGIAGNYLAIKFGILPTISDIKDIVAAFERRKPHLDRFGFRTSSSVRNSSASVNGVTITLEQRAKIGVMCEDSELIQLVDRLDNMGLFPTLENVWDLIPYSFVVDWLVDVGGFLERVDTRLRLARFDVKYVTLSRKERRSVQLVPSASCPYTGTVDQVSYQRWVLDQAPTPPLSATPTPTLASHWLEAGALIIQRKPK